MARDRMTLALPTELCRRLFRFTPVLLVACGILALFAFELWRSYWMVRQDAERHIENLVRLLSEQTARTIQSIDLSIQSVAAELASAEGLADHDPRFLVDLRKRLNALPYARALFVIGADGFITQDTDYPATPRVSLADRSYFIAHRDNPSLGLHIGLPLRSRSVGGWFVSLSRRLDRPDGRFAGIVVAAMEPLYFEQFYRQLWVGGGRIGLFLRDGTLLAPSPQGEGVIGSSFADLEPFRHLLRESAQGIFSGNSAVDNVRQIIGYRALEGQPLVMLVTLNEADAMQPWRSYVATAVAGLAILLAMLAAMEYLSWCYRLREERARARLMEAERLESIGRFAAGVAHDVGNLLRIVQSAVLLIRPHTADKPQAGNLLDQVDATMAVGGELVNQLLSYSRSGTRNPQTGNLNDLVAEALPMLRQAAGPRVEVRASFGTAEVWSRIDHAQFQAALLNLVLNGRDAMPAGGTIVIAVNRLRPGQGDRHGWGEVSVSDDGPGMSKDILRQALDPFFTTKEFGRGSGLGLCQVQAFAAYCKGEMDVVSKEGKGTVIRLRLPLAEDESDKEQQPRI